MVEIHRIQVAQGVGTGLAWVAQGSLLAILVLLVNLPAAAQIVAQDVDYHCTVIASTDQFPEGLHGLPTINSRGRVAFMARRAWPINEIRSGDGSVDGTGIPISSAVARSGAPEDPEAQFSALTTPVIGDDDRIYWHGYPQLSQGGGAGGGIGLYRKRFDRSLAIAAEPVAVSESTRPPGSIDVEEGPTANSTGYILFRGSRIGQSIQSGLFFGRDESAVEVGGYPMEWVMHPGVQPWFGSIGWEDSRYHIWVDDGVPLVSVNGVDRYLRGLSLNGIILPAVSFIEEIYDVPGTSWRLRVEDRLAGEVRLDDGLDTTGFDYVPNQTSLNGHAEVALASRRFGEPLVVTDGETAHRVRCANSASIPGWFVREINLSSRAINNDGQIAFRARTGSIVPSTGADQAYVIRADPLTTAHPSSCVGLPDATPCDDGDGASVAFCSAGVCSAVPEPGLATMLATGLLVLAGVGSERMRLMSCGRCGNRRE